MHAVRNDVDYSQLRFTVDTPEDLSFVRQIFEHFGNDCFSWREVLDLLNRHPELLDINRHIEQKPIPT